MMLFGKVFEKGKRGNSQFLPLCYSVQAQASLMYRYTDFLLEFYFVKKYSFSKKECWKMKNGGH